MLLLLLFVVYTVALSIALARAGHRSQTAVDVAVKSGNLKLPIDRSAQDSATETAPQLSSACSLTFGLVSLCVLVFSFRPQ